MRERKPLRADVQQEIRLRIVDGRLPAGAHLNETHLADELGISRTPLREAMLGLEAAGFLTSDLGRGFRVPQMSAAGFRDLAAVLARLETLALTVTPPPASPRLMEMQNLLGRARLAAARGPDAAGGATASLLSAWSSRLYAACPNTLLREDILRIEALGGRYWHAACLAGFAPTPLMSALEAVYDRLREAGPHGMATIWPDTRLQLTDQAAAALASPTGVG